MCLSTVYEVRNGSEKKIADSVSNVSTRENSVTLTDIMGEETIIVGTILSVDLVRNTIKIAPAQ